MLLATGASVAGANLITNGDFETGTLAGWTTFTTTTPAGNLGSTAVVSFDTDGDSVSSLAARFQVGLNDLPVGGAGGGGGITQSFTSSGAALTISLDIAVQNPDGANASAGVFRLLLDGVQVDIQDFGGIDSGATERDSLNFAGALGAGLHELSIEMTRNFLNGSATPFQFVDDVVVTEAVPVPPTALLLGLGLAGLGAARLRRKS
jgi:hypothetical protein